MIREIRKMLNQYTVDFPTLPVNLRFSHLSDRPELTSSSGLTEAVRKMGQSVSKPRPEDIRVGKPEPYAPGKDVDDWDFTFNGYAGTLDPAYPALLKTARQSPTVVMAPPPHEQQSATLLYLLTMLTQKGARKVVRKAGNNGFEAADNCA